MRMFFWGSNFKVINLLEETDLNEKVKNYKRFWTYTWKQILKNYKFQKTYFNEKKWKIINYKNCKKVWWYWYWKIKIPPI